MTETSSFSMTNVVYSANFGCLIGMRHLCYHKVKICYEPNPYPGLIWQHTIIGGYCLVLSNNCNFQGLQCYRGKSETRSLCQLYTEARISGTLKWCQMSNFIRQSHLMRRSHILLQSAVPHCTRLCLDSVVSCSVIVVTLTLVLLPNFVLNTELFRNGFGKDGSHSARSGRNLDSVGKKRECKISTDHASSTGHWP
jgi:hypothetical protein